MAKTVKFRIEGSVVLEDDELTAYTFEGGITYENVLAWLRRIGVFELAELCEGERDAITLVSIEGEE